MEMQNSFAAGCRDGYVRAESKRECESAKCERAYLRATFFRSVMVPFEQRQQQDRVDCCIGCDDTGGGGWKIPFLRCS